GSCADLVVPKFPCQRVGDRGKGLYNPRPALTPALTSTVELNHLCGRDSAPPIRLVGGLVVQIAHLLLHLLPPPADTWPRARARRPKSHRRAGRCSARDSG